MLTSQTILEQAKLHLDDEGFRYWKWSFGQNKAGSEEALKHYFQFKEVPVGVSTKLMELGKNYAQNEAAPRVNPFSLPPTASFTFGTFTPPPDQERPRSVAAFNPFAPIPARSFTFTTFSATPSSQVRPSSVSSSLFSATPFNMPPDVRTERFVGELKSGSIPLRECLLSKSFGSDLWRIKRVELYRSYKSWVDKFGGSADSTTRFNARFSVDSENYVPLDRHNFASVKILNMFGLITYLYTKID